MNDTEIAQQFLDRKVALGSNPRTAECLPHLLYNIFLTRRNACKLISPLTNEVLTKAYHLESSLSTRDAFPSMKIAALSLFGFEFMSCAFVCYG